MARTVTKIVLAVSVASAAMVAFAPGSPAATPTLTSSLAYFALPGTITPGTPTFGTFSTPTSTFGVTTNANGSYTIDEITNGNGNQITVAPPNGHFVLGQTFHATATDSSTTGQFQVIPHYLVAGTPNPAAAGCPTETATVTVKDVGFAASGAPNRLALGFIDYCGSGIPDFIGNLYLAETEPAPSPAVSVYSAQLASATDGSSDGHVSGYQITPPSGPHQWYITSYATGLPAEEYQEIVNFNVDTNGDGIGDTVQSVPVCEGMPTGAPAGDGCNAVISAPIGTIVAGNTFTIEAAGTSPDPTGTVLATGNFLQTNPVILPAP